MSTQTLIAAATALVLAAPVASFAQVFLVDANGVTIGRLGSAYNSMGVYIPGDSKNIFVTVAPGLHWSTLVWAGQQTLFFASGDCTGPGYLQNLPPNGTWPSVLQTNADGTGARLWVADADVPTRVEFKANSHLTSNVCVPQRRQHYVDYFTFSTPPMDLSMFALPFTIQ